MLCKRPSQERTEENRRSGEEEARELHCELMLVDEWNGLNGLMLRTESW